MILNFIIFLTFIFSLSACVAQKSKVFDSSSLKEAGGNDLIIESAGDGTGSYASGSSYVAGQTATFYAVQRTPINRFIGTTSVTWSIDAKLGYFLTSAVGNSVTVQFTGDGRTTNGTDTAFLMAAKTGFTTRQALLSSYGKTPLNVDR